jgi:hypothetical protein
VARGTPSWGVLVCGSGEDGCSEGGKRRTRTGGVDRRVGSTHRAATILHTPPCRRCGEDSTHQLYLHLPRRAQDVDPLVRILWVLVDRHVLLEPLVQRREVYFDEVFELFGAEDEDAFGRLLAGCGLVGDGERAEVYFVACTRDRAVFGEV